MVLLILWGIIRVCNYSVKISLLHLIPSTRVSQVTRTDLDSRCPYYLAALDLSSSIP